MTKQPVPMKKTGQTAGVLRVALVASDEALRASVRMLLTVSGMEVHEYRTAQQLLADGPASYACLIVDCRLSGMSGRRLCMEIIRHHCEIPIVVLAACPECLDFVKASRPSIRVVRKPFAGDLLIDTVTKSAGVIPDRNTENETRPEARPAAS